MNEEAGWPSERWELLGESIARARRAKGWDQQELANRSGNSPNTISNYERGRAGRSRRVPGGYFRVASALGWPPDAPKEILSGTDPQDVLSQKSLFEAVEESQGAAELQGLVKLEASGTVTSAADNLARLGARDAELIESGYLAQDVFMRQAKRYRKLKGLTVAQVAEAIRARGGAVTEEDLEGLEKGARLLKKAEADFIAMALDTSVEWILGSGFQRDAPEELKWPPSADELEAEAKAVLRRLGDIGRQALIARHREGQARREYEMAVALRESVTAHEREMERSYQYLLGRIDSLRAAAGEPTIMETVPVFEGDENGSEE